MERQDSYLPPAEVVSTGGDPEHAPPPGFVDYWDWTIIRDNAGGVRTGRLATWLREAARTRDPAREILRKAVVARFQATTNDATAESQALADLSVTGRAAFTAFTAAPLRDDELLELARPGLVGIAEPPIRDAVRAVLDRAYTVAWALRGSPSQRAALRPSLGWIALSSEDDPPHAPTNVPASRDHMGELTMRIGQSDQQVTLRATLMLPAALALDPLPDITLRTIPAPTAFADALSDRVAAGYDDLFSSSTGSLQEWRSPIRSSDWSLRSVQHEHDAMPSCPSTCPVWGTPRESTSTPL